MQTIRARHKQDEPHARLPHGAHAGRLPARCANRYITEEREVKKLSLRPDPHMRWIYDYTHPRYNSDEAKDLRERRRAAIQGAPRWMLDEARSNDALGDIDECAS